MVLSERVTSFEAFDGRGAMVDSACEVVEVDSSVMLVTSLSSSSVLVVVEAAGADSDGASSCDEDDSAAVVAGERGKDDAEDESGCCIGIEDDGVVVAVALGMVEMIDDGSRSCGRSSCTKRRRCLMSSMTSSSSWRFMQKGSISGPRRSRNKVVMAAPVTPDS